MKRCFCANCVFSHFDPRQSLCKILVRTLVSFEYIISVEVFIFSDTLIILICRAAVWLVAVLFCTIYHNDCQILYVLYLKCDWSVVLKLYGPHQEVKTVSPCAQFIVIYYSIAVFGWLSVHIKLVHSLPAIFSLCVMRTWTIFALSSLGWALQHDPLNWVCTKQYSMWNKDTWIYTLWCEEEASLILFWAISCRLLFSFLWIVLCSVAPKR